MLKEILAGDLQNMSAKPLAGRHCWSTGTGMGRSIGSAVRHDRKISFFRNAIRIRWTSIISEGIHVRIHMILREQKNLFRS